jgi:CheY-like chemotaxis protein
MPKNEERTLLLVEDSEDDTFLMQNALGRAGIKNPLRVVEDGQQAMDYLAGKGEFTDRREFPYPTLVFLDLKLPYFSGLEVMEWLRRRDDLPATIVIVLTSSSEPSDVEKAYRAGASSFVVKPTTTEQLIDMVKAFGSYWLRHNTFPDGGNRDFSPRPTPGVTFPTG